jgi:hypothetical protein
MRGKFIRYRIIPSLSGGGDERGEVNFRRS